MITLWVNQQLGKAAPGASAGPLSPSSFLTSSSPSCLLYFPASTGFETQTPQEVSSSSIRFSL